MRDIQERMSLLKLVSSVRLETPQGGSQTPRSLWTQPSAFFYFQCLARYTSQAPPHCWQVSVAGAAPAVHHTTRVFYSSHSSVSRSVGGTDAFFFSAADLLSCLDTRAKTRAAGNWIALVLAGRVLAVTLLTSLFFEHDHNCCHSFVLTQQSFWDLLIFPCFPSLEWELADNA